MPSLPSELIIDASILFSFFKSDSSRRKVMEELLIKGCKLFSPYFVIEELSDNKDKILRYAKIERSNFIFSLSVLQRKVKTFHEEKYSEFLSEANKLSPHEEDNKDDPYFALSLALNKIPIWSDEPAFKKQSEIRVFTTKELSELLRL